MTAFLSAHATPVLCAATAAVLLIWVALWLQLTRPEPAGRHRDAATIAWLGRVRHGRPGASQAAAATVDMIVAAALCRQVAGQLHHADMWDGPPPRHRAPELAHYEEPGVVAAHLLLNPLDDEGWWHDDLYSEPETTDDYLADTYVGDVGPGERPLDEPGDRLALQPVATQGQPPSCACCGLPGSVLCDDWQACAARAAQYPHLGSGQYAEQTGAFTRAALDEYERAQAGAQ